MSMRKLDVSLLEESNKRFDKKRNVSIPVEIEGNTQMAVIEIDEVFSPSKIRKCVYEFVVKTDAVRKTNQANFKEVMEAYLVFLIIKHFTSFPAPTPYKEQVRIINMMIDTGLLYTIYAQINQTEIGKIMDEVKDASEMIEDNIEEYIKMGKAMGLDKEE